MELRVSNAFSAVYDIRTESEHKEPACTLTREKEEAEEAVRQWAAKVAHLCREEKTKTAVKTKHVLRNVQRS